MVRVSRRWTNRRTARSVAGRTATTTIRNARRIALTFAASKFGLATGLDLSELLMADAEVEIPIVAGREIIQTVTDVALCGWESVTDAAVCGTKYVEDGALCGWDFVTDGARCGWDAVASWFCDTFDVCDHTARSCNVANTCSVDLSCNVPRGCEVAATCDRVATCEQHVTVPEFNYGTVRGAANVHIGNDGMTASVDADDCLAEGSCSDIGGGRVDLTSSPRVRVTVPGLDREFCAGI